MARIGIYGGSFNPPHIGHILAAKQCKALLRLDKIILVPAAMPPHKMLDDSSPDARTRLHMTQLAVQGLEGFEVSSVELDREGPSYTVDTLRCFREHYPTDELFLLMGNDMFLSFLSWRCPDEISAMATIVCLSRVREEADATSARMQQAQLIERTLGVRPILVSNDCVEVSSTEVRRLLFFGIADSLLDERVFAYIKEQGLYGIGKDYRNLPYEDLKKISLDLHKSQRRVHAAGVAKTAQLLAETYGADLQDAARAGILHDITKALSPAQQLAVCDRLQLPVSEFERTHAKLLHAKTGAGVAEKIFGENAAVCTAIRYHTTGRAHMTLLEKIIYIADYMEPSRCFDGVETLREAVWRDLDEGVLLGIDMTIQQLESKQQVVCSDSLAAKQWLCEEKHS